MDGVPAREPVRGPGENCFVFNVCRSRRGFRRAETMERGGARTQNWETHAYQGAAFFKADFDPGGRA